MTTTNITGVWRSYKGFEPMGRINAYHSSDYREVIVTDEGELLIKAVPRQKNPIIAGRGAWAIEPGRKTRHLYIHKKLMYEIITWEAGDLVLVDRATGEKLFFVQLSCWEAYTRPRKNTVEQQHPIRLWSKSLIERVTV